MDTITLITQVAVVIAALVGVCAVGLLFYAAFTTPTGIKRNPGERASRLVDALSTQPYTTVIEDILEEDQYVTYKSLAKTGKRRGVAV